MENPREGLDSDLDSCDGTVSRAPRPLIQAVQWLPARDVLPREADDFTPWLADNLDILAAAIGLQSLEKVATESAVGDYRLDILARGVEYDGNEISVCIENQYGGTDHKHLGQLVTYLAKHGSGLAVWVVEDASAAHVAAVDFLNRTSDNSVGYLLVRTRFTRGAADAYQVHFEPLARPNAFTKQPRRRRFTDDDTDGGPARGPRKAFLDRVLPVVRRPLIEAGFPNLNVHASGSYLWVRWPADTFIANLCSGYVHLRVTKTHASVNVHVSAFDTREGNAAAIDVFHDHYGPALEHRLGPQVTFRWHAGQGPESDRVSIIRDGKGYDDGDPTTIGDWLASTTILWLSLVRNNPIPDLAAQVQDRLARSGSPALDVNP